MWKQSLLGDKKNYRYTFSKSYSLFVIINHVRIYNSSVFLEDVTFYSNGTNVQPHDKGVHFTVEPS